MKIEIDPYYVYLMVLQPHYTEEVRQEVLSCPLVKEAIRKRIRMINKFKIDGIECHIDDGDPNTADITYYDGSYAKEKDKERIEWLKKQLRHYGYKFINKNGEQEL